MAPLLPRNADRGDAVHEQAVVETAGVCLAVEIVIALDGCFAATGAAVAVWARRHRRAGHRPCGLPAIGMAKSLTIKGK